MTHTAPAPKDLADLRAPGSGRVTWTDTMQATLIAMAAERKSGTQIGAALGLTRNAILGRAHRTGVKLFGVGGRPPESVDFWAEARALAGRSPKLTRNLTPEDRARRAQRMRDLNTRRAALGKPA